MQMEFNTVGFGPGNERYALKPYCHRGKHGYVIGMSVGDKTWNESFFHHNKLDAVDHILRMLFLKPCTKALYNRSLDRYPYFDYQKLATRTFGFKGSYTLSLIDANNNTDIVYDDLVDDELKKISKYRSSEDGARGLKRLFWNNK